MNTIHDPEHSEIHFEILMVLVVESWLVSGHYPGPPVSRVMQLCAHDREDDPTHDSEDVRIHQQDTPKQRNDVGHEHLKRMTVCRYKGRGERKLVMKLVDSLV